MSPEENQAELNACRIAIGRVVDGTRNGLGAEQYDLIDPFSAHISELWQTVEHLEGKELTTALHEQFLKLENLFGQVAGKDPVVDEMIKHELQPLLEDPKIRRYLETAEWAAVSGDLPHAA